MKRIELEAMELTEFVKHYIPSIWKEPIEKVCHTHYFMWYEIEAIRSFYKIKEKEK